MIGTIGFLENSEKTMQQREFAVDQEIQEKLSYLNIPVFPREESVKEDVGESDGGSDEDAPPVLKESDSLLFCTSNTEEISAVAFYGYDDVEMFLHHDLFVFSTILDACPVRNSLVAVATFEPTIFIYDFCVDFPVLPQFLLEGHEGAVTGIKNLGCCLVSCSDDKSIIEWDLERLCVRNRRFVGVSMERFDCIAPKADSKMAGTFDIVDSMDKAANGMDKTKFDCDPLVKSTVFGAGRFLNINNENICLEHDIEQLKLRGCNVFVSDCEGNLLVFDTRAPAKAVITRKAHQGAITDICLAGEWISTTSVDSHVKMWKLEGDLVCKNDLVQDLPVYALGFNESGREQEIFAGNGEEYVYPLKLEENAGILNK